MEDSPNAAVEAASFWSLAQISLASYIAGPFAGCCLLSQNFKVFGNFKAYKMVQYIGVISVVVLGAICCFLPSSIWEHIPKIMIPITYTGIISSFAHAYQKIRIVGLIADGKKRHSYFKFFLIVLFLLVVQVSLVFLFAYLISFL